MQYHRKVYYYAKKLQKYISRVKSFTKQACAKENLREPEDKEYLWQALDVLHSLELIQKQGRTYQRARFPTFQIEGVISIHPHGFAFVVPTEEYAIWDDIFVPKSMTLKAMSGDKVKVKIKGLDSKGPEGEVLAILERARSEIACTVTGINYGGTHRVHSPSHSRLHDILFKTKPKNSLKVGDRILVKVEDWGKDEDDPWVVTYKKLVGKISEPKTDISYALAAYHVRSSFKKSVLDEAESFGTRVKKKDLEGRKDLRDLITFTIDPVTAKDFDDAISIRPFKKGYELYVHIADVSHYVVEGGLIDHEAKLRCNSTYFPGKCIPMLPPSLADNLCSLKPKVNRLAVSTRIIFDSEGHVDSYQFMRSVIRSDHRMTYGKVRDLLNGKSRSSILTQLEWLSDLCSKRKAIRSTRGVLDLNLPALLPLVDAKGNISEFQVEPYDLSHQMVEELMVLNNSLVAQELYERFSEALYRVHEPPSPEKLNSFNELISRFGFKLQKDEPVTQSIIDEFASMAIGPYLCAQYIKSMKIARYSVDSFGHFGLRLDHYSHFTSPIRRYADLVCHRLLFEGNFDINHLQRQAIACSEQERVSEKAEKSVLRIKKLRYLAKKLNDETSVFYKGMITEIKPFGVIVEIPDLQMDSFVHVSELNMGYFTYNQDAGRLELDYGGCLTVGTECEVELVDIDLLGEKTQWNVISVDLQRDSAFKRERQSKKRRRHSKKKRSKSTNKVYKKKKSKK